METKDTLTQQMAYDLHSEGWTYREIADSHGASYEAVRSKIRRFKTTVPAAEGKERVLVIADTHCPAMHEGYVDFLLSIYHKHKCTRVVHSGDLCFPREVELLTENGFVPFDAVKSGQKVMQVDEFGKASLVEPLRVFSKLYDGKILRQYNSNYDIASTPDHQMVIYNKKSGKERKVPASEMVQYPHCRVPRTCLYDGPGIDWTDDEIRLQVAIMADFSVSQNKYGFRAGFKKDRKKERIRSLLQSVGLEYSDSVESSRKDYAHFRILSCNGDTKFSKSLPDNWLINLSHHQACVLIEELGYWDGHIDPNRERMVFSSSRKEERNFVNELCALHGIQSTIQKDGKRVNVLNGKKDTLIKSLRTEELPSDGEVFCVTVPTGKIVVKYNDRISVCGNCDWNAISFHEKDPSMPSAADEFVAASKQVRQLHKAFPKVDYLIGNHSALPERKAKAIGLPDGVLKNFKTLWGLDGWTIHPRFTDLVIDGVIYRHGDKEKGGQMAALKNAQAQFTSLVQGHLHAQAGVNYHANQNGTIFGMSVGCGVNHDHPAMNYGRVYAAKPVLGCGVVYSKKLAFFEPMFID